jgi:hypothetical protein
MALKAGEPVRYRMYSNTWLCQQPLHFACRPFTHAAQATSRSAAFRHLFLATVSGASLVPVLVCVGVHLEILPWEKWKRNLKCYRNSMRCQRAFAIIRGRCSLVDYCDIKFGWCRANYGISWHRGGPGSSVGVPTELRAGRPGDRIPVGRDFPPVQTGPGAHAASCTMGTGSFPRVNYGWGVLLTTQPLLMQRSIKDRSIPLPTLEAI